MISFVAGLFVGEATFEEIRDNLDLERWFRLPKSHERRIHGHRHAGVRIVQEGPTIVHALDAHFAHPERFTGDDLLPYRTAREPTCQREAMNRRKIRKKARSSWPNWNVAIVKHLRFGFMAGRCLFYSRNQTGKGGGKDSGKKPNRVNLITNGLRKAAENLENWPRGMGQFWHRPFVSNMTGSEGRCTKTGRKYTFCHATVTP
jgi:hypothetical protein